MSIDDLAVESGMCVSHCEHGGVCILDLGHKGIHDSEYCQWTDQEAISKEEADRKVAQIPGGPEFLAMESMFASLFEGSDDD